MKNPWKRLAVLTVGAALCLCQTGCAFPGLDAQNLMVPRPGPTWSSRAFTSWLQGDSQELTFVYPRRGEHRSAIIMTDWNGDGVSDAWALPPWNPAAWRSTFWKRRRTAGAWPPPFPTRPPRWIWSALET